MLLATLSAALDVYAPMDIECQKMLVCDGMEAIFRDVYMVDFNFKVKRDQVLL